jgi:hypothetical protein
MEAAPFCTGFIKEHLFLDGASYEIFKKQTVFELPNAPRLAVVSCLPSVRTIPLLMLCIKTIKNLTVTPYELWIVDNNSPFENIKWLLEEEGLNIILNRTGIEKGGSYANAIGLELVAQSISPATKYFMSLHQDCAPCKQGWLDYLLSKLNKEVKAAGVRLDKTRIKDGILHVLGYVIDFQIFKALNLDFFPELPFYDVGDKAIVKLKEAGYKIFASPNTLWDRSLVEKIPVSSPFRKLNVDRSFDDNGDVFFLHLGRGVEKSQGKHINPDKSIERWKEFINSYLLPNQT